MRYKKKIYIQKLLFYIFWSALLLTKGLGFSEGEKVFYISFSVAIVAVAGKIIATKYSIQQFALYISLILIGILSTVISKELGTVINILIVVGCCQVPIKELEKLSLTLWEAVFAIQAILVGTGIRSQIFKIHRKFGKYIVRWSLGFTHPNVFHISYFILSAFYLLVKHPHGKNRIRSSIYILLGNILIFMYSASITGFLIVNLYVILSYIFDKGVPKKRLIITVITLIPIACASFAIFGPLLIKGNAFDIIDKFVSTRFSLSRYFLTTQNIGPFGTYQFNLPDRSYTLDSSYLYSLFHQGYIICIAYIITLSILTYFLIKTNRSEELAITLTCAVAGITEQFLSNSSFKNITLIFIAEMIYDYFNNKHIVKISVINITKSIEIPDAYKYMEYIHIKRNALKKRLLLVQCTAFIIGLIGYMAFVPKPNYIYASPWDCDLKEENDATRYVYYEQLDTKSADFHDWVMSNSDADGKLYDFSGFTVEYEYYRRAIALGIAVATISYLTENILLGIKSTNDENIDAC